MFLLKILVKYSIFLIYTLNVNAIENAQFKFRSFVRFMEDVLKNSGVTYEVPQLVKLIDDIPYDLSQKIMDDYNEGLTNEDVYLDVTQLIHKYGFKCETHQVRTIDGYLITLHRIPGEGKPILLMHGLQGSSDDWIVNGPESGIAYLLAREGYDVWMGNARGNKHSRKHTYLNPEDPKYWDFSWEEIGLYDLPAAIDHVLYKSEQEQLTYIGFSEGTTVFYVLCSMLPEYNDKISLMISLGAVAFMSHITSPLVRFQLPFVYIWDLYKDVLDQIPPNYNFTKALQDLLCGQEIIAETVCINIFFLGVGFDYKEVNSTNLPVFFGHFPSGSSTKQSVHYGQEILSGKFRRFDYGPIVNLEKYGNIDPPDYPIKKIKAPIAIFHGLNDWLADTRDVDKLISQLSNIVLIHRVPDYFSHIDYVWAKDVKELIYPDISRIIERYA